MKTQPLRLAKLLVLLACLGPAIAAMAQDAIPPVRPDLHGVVTNTHGAAVAGAHVFIHTAGPRQGVGLLCPSCYGDCRKSAVTDERGKFKIEALDPALIFTVLVVASGHLPRFTERVEPAKGLVNVVLAPAAKPLPDPHTRLRGRVINPEGKPVAGAVVTPKDVEPDETISTSGGTDLDPLAVTDEKGEFTINAAKPFKAVTFDVEAPGLAKRIFPNRNSGDTAHQLRLTEGVSVSGLVVQDGKPVPGVALGLSGVNRDSREFIGDFTAATGADGRFQFVNIPPATALQLFGRMNSLTVLGAIPSRRVRTGDDGERLDVGKLVIQPAARLAGQLVLSTGKPLPPNSQVTLGREDAWDHAEVVVKPDGRFEFLGVPKAEVMSLSAYVKGYRYSGRNASLDTLNPYSLLGTVKVDKTDLVLLLEPGGELESDSAGYNESARFDPLCGAEPRKPSSVELQITGRVTDVDTGEPVRRFTVTPGQPDDFFGKSDWQVTRRTTESNGTFTIFVTSNAHPPMVAVEAEGYLPQTSGPITNIAEPLRFKLKQGTGPAGIVLLPDGKPAAGITVYLCDEHTSLYSAQPGLAHHQSPQKPKYTTTDAQGGFSFPPLIGAYCVMVFQTEGFALVKVGELALSRRVPLQKWGRVTGKLTIGTKPCTNETVRLGLARIPYADEPRLFPPLSLFHRSKTDAQGRFEFQFVPPVDCQVFHEPHVHDAKMGTIAQTQIRNFNVKPGANVEVALGGEGCPIIGKVVLKGYEGAFDWRQDAYWIELERPKPNEIKPTVREIVQALTQKVRDLPDASEARKQAMEAYERERKQAEARDRAFYRTEAGRAYAFASRRYTPVFQPDGSFRAEDVPAGDYKMQLLLLEPWASGMSHMGQTIANIEKTFTVPKIPDGRSDEPFDVGTFEVTAHSLLKPGKPAPNFSVENLDGQPLKLADFRGKFVLLDFWAVWCGPCVAEIPHLKAVHEKFGGDERFAMISLSLDAQAETARRYCDKAGIKWPQGFLGDWSKATLPKDYGVHGIPAIFLIGPDGKIVASQLRGEAITAAVERALRSKQR